MKSSTRNTVDFAIFGAFFFITFVCTIINNYVFFTNIIIQLLLDTVGNIGGVVTASFLFIWWSGRKELKSRLVVVFAVGSGLIIYEFLQILIPWQTFDVNDIFGTLIGVVIASIINVLIVIFEKQKLSR